MAGNYTFQQKRITYHRKTLITYAKSYDILLKQKGFESFGSVFVMKKKFVLGVAHGDPIFAQVGPKNSNFQRFQQKFFRTAGFQLKCLILIEFPNILHWKPAKKPKLGVVLGQNLGHIMSNVLKIVKKQAISLSFLHILLREYLLKQKVVVVKPPVWKFMAIIAKNVKF